LKHTREGQQVTPEEINAYNALPLHEKAKYLLSLGITARLDIDRETLAPGYVAFAGESSLPAAGYHRTEAEAIAAGTKWLEEKASPPQAKDDGDPLYAAAVMFTVDMQRVSIATLQRALKTGYNRAARLIEDMEVAGIVSPADRLGRRTVLLKSTDIRVIETDGAYAAKVEVINGSR
jgi:DNA segregation ATPase FtsK/SpoIIIE-like protein